MTVKTRKDRYGTDQKRRNVNLDNLTYAKAKKIGSGNYSEGIRVAVDAYKLKIKGA